MVTKTKEKKRTKKQNSEAMAQAERLANIEFRALPPDTYKKRTVWNTPDGEAPVAIRCKMATCPEMTITPPLCEGHFYGLVKRVQGKIITKQNGAKP